MKALIRRAKPFARGLKSYVVGWRGLVLAVMAIGLVVAVDAIDVPSWVNGLAALTVVSALAALLSAAARSGGSKPATKPARPKSEPAPGPEDASIPRVSLIITAYHDERFVRACLASASAQRYPNLEIIVVDDAGTDGTAAIVREVMADDQRISMLRHTANLGLAAARNTGLAAATGEYVTFLDADDFLIKQSIGSRARRLLRATDPRVIGSYCGWEQVPEDAANDIEITGGAPKRKVTFLEAGGENPFIATAPMLRRDVAVSVGGFDEDLKTGEDFDFWMRVLRQGYAFVSTGSVGVAYRQKAGGMVADGPALHARSAAAVYDYLDREMYAEEVAPGAPAPFHLPIDRYFRDMRWVLRVGQFVTFAQFGGESTATEDLLEMVPETARTELLEHRGEFGKRLDASIRRIRLRDPEMSDARADLIRSRASAVLHAKVVSLEAAVSPDLGAGSAAEQRLGTYDDAACRQRIVAVGAVKKSSGIRVVLWAGADNPRVEDVEAGDGGGTLIVALGPTVAVDDATMAALDAQWKNVRMLQSRRLNDIASLVGLAGLVLDGAAPGVVTIDRFDSDDLREDELAAAAAFATTSSLETGAEAPFTAVIVDQAGQAVDARRWMSESGEPARLVHLGPVSDVAADADMVSAFDLVGRVHALAVVYPYGPMVSALVDAAKATGVSTYEIAPSEVVDRVADSGASPVSGAISALTPASAAVSWAQVMAEVAKPWRALNIGDRRRTQRAAAIVKRGDVAAFKDRHKGERCVVIGNGPSLNKLDLTAIAGEVTFGVNSIYLADEQMGFTPTYYMVEDTLVMKENVQDILDYPVDQKFFPSAYSEHFGDDPAGVTFFDMDGQFYSPGSAAFGVPRFSDDYAVRGFCGQSVTILNLQLAFHMGFAEVYMIGMDFSYVLPESTIVDGNLYTSTEDDPNHFHPKYFGAGKTWKDPKLDRVLASYQLAKRVYEQHDREIINATAGGALELFRRADYHEVFGGTPPAGLED